MSNEKPQFSEVGLIDGFLAIESQIKSAIHELLKFKEIVLARKQYILAGAAGAAVILFGAGKGIGEVPVGPPHHLLVVAMIQIIYTFIWFAYCLAAQA